MLALFAAVLTGCGGGGGQTPVRSASARAPAAAQHPRSSIVVVPEVMAPKGLGGVIGSPAAALTSRFGKPRIDLVEGDAEKLQFAGKTCVLDIYLYPVRAGAQPTATHVDARIRQGGAPTDPGACIREVEQR